jgi:hypothetical protein
VGIRYTPCVGLVEKGEVELRETFQMIMKRPIAPYTIPPRGSATLAPLDINGQAPF